MSLLNSTLQTLVVRVRDISGKVMQQKLHNRVFDAYEAKNLAFEMITPTQQAVMQQYGGRVPSTHPAGQPLLVDSWVELVQLHRPDNLYQLLPRRARTNEAYGVLKAICNSAGSPFAMEHCKEPMDYKLTFKSAQDFDMRAEFNTKHTDKVPQTIFPDGIMAAPTASALISFPQSFSTAHISNLAGVYEFLSTFVKTPSDGDRHRQLKLEYGALLSKPTHLFIGSNTTPSRETLNFAKSKNVFVYAKKGAVYQYLP